MACSTRPQLDSHLTFAGEVHGLLPDPVAGARDGHFAAEDGLPPQRILLQDLVHRDVEETATLHRQRRCYAALRRTGKKYL